MIREICKDTALLRLKAEPAAEDDLALARDLMDTLLAHSGECVGMAANMIGAAKAIIAVNTGKLQLLMLNPRIEKHFLPYDTEEGCLSLEEGRHPCVRYKTIEVTYQDERMRMKRGKYTGFAAEIIQHECDHLEGILI